MTSRPFFSCQRLVAATCAALAAFFGSSAITRGATQLSPQLFSVSSSSTRAVVLESVSMRSEPFSLSSEGNFSPNDPRTRITLFCMNLDLLAGEGFNALTADAEDAAHLHYAMKVEYVGAVPGFDGVSMVVLRLNDLMTSNLGDVLIRMSLHGMSSNRVRVAIGQIGGGPADDNPGVGTPAPQATPAATTPLTLAQFQTQAGSAGAVAGADGIRFLEQATWGPTSAELTTLRAKGIQQWLTDQFNTPPQFSDVQSDYPLATLYPVSQPSPCDATCQRDNYSLYPLQKQFMTNALTQPDQLRQRVTFALHKLIVVAGRDLNGNEPSWYAPYLQAIDRNAFGNYRTLLNDVTLNPGMGLYLSMAGNARAAPNENYAREVMQLFSVGTDLLNPDGTPVLDADGDRIPTYGQTEITNFARVFTGWVIPNTTTNTFNGQSVPDYIRPMAQSNNAGTFNAGLNSYSGVFDTGPKTLLGGAPLAGAPAGLNTAAVQLFKRNELSAAMDNLFNHQNTGPYVCTALIRQLVTSNPSPAYVGRCAASFANNGSGVRGDMKAIITEILLDPEARGDVKTDPSYGRLREPVLLMTDLLRTFNATSDGVLVTNSPSSLSQPLGQDVFNPPTVFSYFPADFGLPGTSLFAPEFGILDTSSTYQRANFVNTLFLANSGNGIPISSPNRPTGTQLNYATYQALAGTPSSLVDLLNTNMMHGTMSSSMRTSIINTVTAISSADAANRTRTSIYLVATSSQYQVQR
jgi:uncharacterized protein (DUF1800 family)